MRALPFKIPYGAEVSLIVLHEKLPHFYGTYHTHEELQLMLVLKGHGTAYIGDKILPFRDGDIFLLGKELPHVFKDDVQTREGIEYLGIFFLPDFMGSGFLDLPEARGLTALMEESKLGIRLRGREHPEVVAGIRQVEDRQELGRLLALVETLDLIVQASDREIITNPGFNKPKRSEDGKKINDVFNFLMANYHREIRLEEVAGIANMSPTAFCRYFKHHTRKTYSRFLNEIRVGKACKMLSDGRQSIASICYQSGFGNISNFNRQFKRITGYTPTQYQKLQQ